MERKTSLAARLQRLGPFPDSQTAGPDASQAPPAPTQPADANPAALQQQQQQQQPKRRLPQWLAPPPPAPDPAPSAVPQQQLQPKVSIRARVAAASAAAPLGVSSPDPATPAAAAATAVADKAPAGTSLLGRSSDGTKALPGAAAVVGVPGSRVHAGEGQKVSLAARLAMPRTYSLAPAMPAPEANPGPAATAAPAAASSQQALGAGRQQVSQAGLALQPTQQNEPQQQEEQQQPGEPEQQQHSPANHHPQLLLGTDASLWESESDAEQEQRTGQAAPDPRQQQEQQQQQQQPLTLQQRQQRQMAQLGLKLPGAGGGADEDAWLREVFASAGSGGRSRKKGAGASGGRSGGGAAAAGGGSGGRSGGAAAAAAAGGSSGHSRARASSGGAAAGSGGAAAAGHAHLGAAAAEDDIEAAAAAAAAGAGAVGGEEGVAADPLVLFDEEANLRLQVPGSINQHLRSYQREGVQFLFSRYAAGSGGVLCDDMGLGKTVQAISFIAALLGKQGTPQDAHPRSFAAYRRQRQQQRHLRRQLCGDDSNSGEEDEPVEDAGSTLRWPVLVVCPTSVLDNWMRELNMWGTFKAIKYHGPPAVREGIAEQASDGRFEVILTSYDTLRVDAAALASLHPHAVVFDEAHKLKNAKSKQYEAAASLPTKYRYGLSGTIMQNDWDELFAVLDLLCPYCLGEYGGFVEYYSKPIKRGQSSTASNYEVVKGEKRRRQLVEVVKKVALRRTKAIISDQLPRKTDNVVFCQLQPLQYRAYDRTLASPDLQALRLAKSPCDCGSGLKSGECCHGMVPASEGGVLWPHYHECNCRLANCNRHRPLGCQEYYESQGYNNPRLRCPYCLMLPAISLLTKISNHLELIRPDAKLQQQDERQFEFELAVARMVLGDDAHQLGGLLANSSGWLGASDETHCGKMATLKLLLGTWASDYSCNNKVLLFSHSTRCLDLLEAFVQRQGYDYVRLDGSTPQKLRQGICDEFNSRPSIFLLLMSTVAGGLGLNLTAANKVVVFDPSWNPAHDLQAQDRAYRLGQTRDVAVYRLVGTGTLEEAVYKRQIYKQQQSNMVIDAQEEPRYWEGVQGDTDKPGELWGLWNLLRFSGQTVETRDILQAYQGRHRQQIEQQLQDDARRQQQQQPAGVQPSGAGAAAAAGAPAAAAAKPFKIIMVDDLVGDAGDSAVLEGAPGFEGAAASGGGGSSRRGGRGSGGGSRKRHGSDDAGGCTSDAGEGEAGAPGAAAAAGAGAGDGVGGMAVSEAAWCDEALLGGLLDELLPGDGTLPGSQQQLRQGRRKRRHTILSDSEDEGGAAAGAAAGERHHARGAGGPAGALRGLSPVSEEEEEVGSELCDSMAGASEEPGLSTDSAGGFEEPVVAVDPVLAALEQQGAILHAHRHEKVLGKAKKPRAAQQQQHDSQHSSQPGSQPQRRRGQQQRPARQQDDSLGDPSNLLRRSVAAACSGLCPSAAAAAEAAADKGWGPVASLAVWQGVGVVEMAEWLLQLTAEQRQQVLEMYSDDLL